MFGQSCDQLNEPSPWQVRFEDARVKMVLREFHLLAHLKPLLDDFASQHGPGPRRLTFAAFRKRFDTFPILLAAQYHARVAEFWSPATLFRSFQGVFLLQSYLAIYSRLQDEAPGETRPIAMAVPFDGIQGGMVVHNGSSIDTRGTKMTHDIAGDVPPYRVTVEPFRPFLRYLAAGGWTPKAPLSDRLPTHSAQVSHEIGITPWMTQTLGPGPALVLLGWLRSVLGSSSGYARHFVRRLKSGERCVVATQKEMIEATGLSERQVQRALATLRKKDLIATRLKQRCTQIRVNPVALAGLRPVEA